MVLRRTRDHKIYSHPKSVALCTNAATSILSQKAFASGCTAGIVSQDILAWVGGSAVSGYLSDTRELVISVNDTAVKRYAVCEFSKSSCSLISQCNVF